MILLLVLLLFCFPCFSEEGSPDSSLLIVHVPAVDLRREPVPAKKNDFSHDPLQETQLFYGEKVKVLEQKNGWSRVEALEQLEWTHHEKWEGYPGWVRSDHLTVTPPSGWEPDQVITAPTAEIREKPEEDAPVLLRLFLGARIVGAQLIAPLQPESFSLWQSVLLIDGRTGWIQKDQISSFGGGSQTAPTQLRQKIVATARTLLGKPYHWGGLSEGVDCSGLVYLCYRANGIDLPRDAHEQFMKSRIMDIPAGANGRSPLQPADLIFLSSEENPNRMTHVMLYSGDGNIIEGPGTGTFVHEISMSEKLKGIPQRRIHSATVLK